MLAARFLAFWLQGLDTTGRSSGGKTKLIRPGVWLCFEGVPRSLSTLAVSARRREVTPLDQRALGSLGGLPRGGEGRSPGRTGIGAALLERAGCQYRLAARTRRSPPPLPELKLTFALFHNTWRLGSRRPRWMDTPYLQGRWGGGGDMNQANVRRPRSWSLGSAANHCALGGELLLVSVSDAHLCEGVLVISPKAVLKMKGV